MRQKGVVIIPLLAIVVVVLVGLMYLISNTSQNNVTQKQQKNGGNQITADLNMLYYYDSKGGVVVTTPDWNDFDKLKENHEILPLVTYDSDKYFSGTRSPYLDTKSNTLYYGLLSIRKSFEEGMCQYITDIYKTEIGSNEKELVFSHDDCSKTYPYIAPAIIQKFAGNRFLVLTVGYCSECDSAPEGPDKIIALDLTTGKDVVLDNIAVEDIDFQFLQSKF